MPVRETVQQTPTVQVLGVCPGDMSVLGSFFSLQKITQLALTAAYA